MFRERVVAPCSPPAFGLGRAERLAGNWFSLVCLVGGIHRKGKDMTRTFLLILCASVVVHVSPASARPNFGRNCGDCHGAGPLPVADALQLINFDGLVDPDESFTGATDRGTLKFYDVFPGDTVDLTIRVDFQDAPEVHYAVELKRMETLGVEGGGTLTQTPDPDWFPQTGSIFSDPDRPYFTIPEADGIHPDGPRTFTFTMLVDESTNPDFYDLEFAMAGQPEFFYTDEHFYLRVIPEPATIAFLSLAVLAMRRRARVRR